MDDEVVCPDCNQPIVYRACRSRKDKPMSDQAREAMREVILAMHRKMAHPVAG